MDLPKPAEALKEEDPGRQSITINEAKPEEVPAEIKKKLLKKSNQVIKGINDHDGDTLKKLDENEAFKVPYFD